MCYVFATLRIINSYDFDNQNKYGFKNIYLNVKKHVIKLRYFSGQFLISPLFFFKNTMENSHWGSDELKGPWGKGRTSSISIFNNGVMDNFQFLIIKLI